MLTKEQINEIREHLEKANNPLFFFDNDADGLVSFLLLARNYKKGKGVAVKSRQGLSKNYLRKVHELKPDYVFVLDKPVVEQEFIDEVKELNLPLVWIDHHNVSVEKQEGVDYYNSFNGKIGEPVAYCCWKIVNEKDLWLALAGCVSDSYMPEFAENFSKEYPELWSPGIKTAFDALYKTQIGKIARIMNFCLKDTTSNVLKMQKFLLKVSAPQEILNEDKIFVRFEHIEKRLRKLIEKADEDVGEKMLYFQYAGDLSISSDVSNELIYKYPHKLIVVVYISGTKANISVRGKKAREITLKAIEGLKDATGGGHEQATGAKINVEDLHVFKERVEKLVS